VKHFYIIMAVVFVFLCESCTNYNHKLNEDTVSIDSQTGANFKKVISTANNILILKNTHNGNIEKYEFSCIASCGTSLNGYPCLRSSTFRLGIINKDKVIFDNGAPKQNDYIEEVTLKKDNVCIKILIPSNMELLPKKTIKDSSRIPVKIK